MHILIVAATKAEIEPLISKFNLEQSLIANRMTRYQYINHSIDLLITGVGILPTAFWMGKVLSNGNYDFAINAGVAGSFSKALTLGEVVNINEDYLMEAGAENDSDFLTLSDLKLLELKDFPNTEEGIKSTYDFENPVLTAIKKVNGITVNTTHGNPLHIKQVCERYKRIHGKEPVTESMEGAAFLFACIHEKVPCLQMRAISNYIEKRDTNAWKLELAIRNLNTKVVELLDSYADEN